MFQGCLKVLIYDDLFGQRYKKTRLFFTNSRNRSVFANFKKKYVTKNGLRAVHGAFFQCLIYGINLRLHI